MLPLLLLSLAVAAPETPPPVVHSAAQPMAVRPPLPPPFPRALHDEAVELLMARFDADHDGALNEEEAAAVKQCAAKLFAQKKKAILDRYDLDRDGRLNEKEEAQLKQDWEREHPGIGRRVRIHMVRLRRAERKEFFRRFDSNHDGVLDENERRTMHEQINSHRREDSPELPQGEPGGAEPSGTKPSPGRGSAPAPPRTLRALGIPPEAGIVLEHLLLERYDTDQNGILSSEEIDRAMKRPDSSPAENGGAPPASREPLSEP